jgi:uncharacterized membrane-anchored protein
MNTGILAPAGALIVCISMTFADARAQENPAPAGPPNPVKAAWEAARQAMVQGPGKIELSDQATLDLPQGDAFVPRKESAELMRLMGNTTDERFIGLVFPMAEDKSWMVTVEYEAAGYIKDEDAKDWKSDELLQSLKDGTEAGNAERERMGIPALRVTRWIEPPRYDAGTHQLVWSIEARRKVGEDPDPTVNYNTYVLGRGGYISLDLVTSLSLVDLDKPSARELLSAVKYKQGKGYADFNSSTDKVAAYGLAALIVGVAAKKLGLLAVIAAFVVKFAKVIALAVAGFGAGIAKWFRKRRAGA